MGNQAAQIHSKFNSDFKAKYIEGLKKAYLGVLLSIELNSKTSKINGVKTQIESLIRNQKIQDKITIEGQEIDVTLTKQNGIINVEFAKDSSEIGIKNTGDYTTEDLLALCAQHELTIGKDNEGNNVFSVKIKGAKDATIGGPGKISIFSQHLSYVKETIDHLEVGGNPITELALATGTGKTFIELLVEYLPARLMGIRYVSIAPDESLVGQKRSDWKKLLSDADINDIELDKISDKKGCSILSNNGLVENWDQFLEAVGLQQLPNIIEALKIGDKSFKIKNGKINIDGKDFIISTNEIQFDNKKYKITNGKVKINNQEFEIDITKPISLSFDEEHRVIEEELYKYRMQLLSTLCPTLFLSATPSSDTYKRVQEDGGLIKTLSLKDKMKSGAYGPLELKVHQKEKGDLVNNYIEELKKVTTFKEKPDKNKKSFYHEPQTSLTGEDLKKDIENYIFHNIQSVIGEPALVLAESGDLKSKLKKEVTYDIFKDEGNNGNHSHIVSQKCDAVIDHLCDVYGSDKSTTISATVKDILDYKSGIHDYSAFRVMHGVIDNTLSYLTGLSKSELDEARFSDLEELVVKVKESLGKHHNLREYVTEQGIKSDHTAQKIAGQMQSVINILERNQNNNDLFARLVRNWNQDKKLHTMMPPSIPNDKDDIMKLFGIKKDYINSACSDAQKIEFKPRKSDEIFQYLKDGYEVNGNIQNIEEECNVSYAELKKAERERLTYYNQNIKQHEDDLIRVIPKYYHWNLDSCTLSKFSSFFRQDYKLSDDDKKNYESKLRLLQEALYEAINNPAYKALVRNVSNKKYAIFQKFNKVQQFFQQDVADYPLADLRKFSDEYRYIEGNDQDHDALLRMGLCGNYVNHKRIQGFNAIDLQHTVMLVDEKSSFINDPPQLIQGPGRLRCLNPARLSTLFCHSSDKLKFDIELLQKGNYIDAYNKVMEGNNKKSPEELGNEILETIEKLIEDGVSKVITDNKNEKFKEVDDLAATVLDRVISSLNVVYNNKGHNAKETLDYFVKVLNHVTSQVEKQLNSEVLGNLDIERNIRGIQSKIDNIINKIQESAKNKEAAGEKLQIDGNIIKRLMIKLYRLIRRLIVCRIELEKEKMKFEKEEKSLNQEEKKLEKEKSNLEKQIKTEKKQEFIGVMKKESNVQKKEVNEKEREDIIAKQKEYLSNEIKKAEQELQELKENAVLKKFEETKKQIKEFALELNLQDITASIDTLHKAKDQVIALMDIAKQLNEKIQNNCKELQAKKQDCEKALEKKSKLEQSKTELNDKLYYSDNTIDYGRYYDDVINRVSVYKSIIKEYDAGKVVWIGRIAEEFIKVINNDYYTKFEWQYYTKHINSCVNNPIFLELLSNIVMPLYNDGMLLGALEMIYPDASNTSKVEKICALYDNLSKKGEPDLSNVKEVMIYAQQIAKVVGDAVQSYYDNKKCDFLKDVADNNFSKPDHIAKGCETFFKLKFNDSVEKTKSETKRVQNREALKVKSDIYECILTPMKEKLNQSHSSEGHWVQNDPSKQEKVAFVAKKVGLESSDITVLTCGDIISPNTKCLNPIQAKFPKGEMPGLLDNAVAQQWPGEKLCVIGG